MASCSRIFGVFAVNFTLGYMSNMLMTFFDVVVIPGFVAGGTAFAALKFFGQRFVDHKLGKDFERYKSELGEKTEALKTQLSIYSHEQAVEISRVDAQSAEAISKVYAKMREVINPISRILSGTPIIGGSDRQSIEIYLKAAEEAHAAFGRLVNTIADHAIYFEEPAYLQLSELTKGAGKAVASYLQPLRKAIAEGESDAVVLSLAEKGRPLLQSAYDAYVRPQHAGLVAEFRRRLGIQQK